MNTQEPNPFGPALRAFRDPGYEPLADNLAQIRAHIDAIDEKIVTLLSQRGRYVKDAARFKRNSFEVSAPKRQQEVIDKVRRIAEMSGAYPEVVEACYRAMIAGFIAREQQDHLQMIDVVRDAS